MTEYDLPTFPGKILSVWPVSPYFYSFDLDARLFTNSILP